MKKGDDVTDEQVAGEVSAEGLLPLSISEGPVKYVARDDRQSQLWWVPKGSVRQRTSKGLKSMCFRFQTWVNKWREKFFSEIEQGCCGWWVATAKPQKPPVVAQDGATYHGSP